MTGPCLTIYQSLRDEYSQVAKPETRLVAAIQEAGRLLEENGFDPGERDEMLRPLLKLASNTDWTGRKGSFVMFRAPDFTMAKFWPDEMAPRIHFAQEFLVLPLLPGLLSKRDFWLLSLSIKAVRLFRGSGKGLAEVELPAGVPRSLAEAGGFDQPDHTLRNRSTAGPSLGNMAGVPFGTSSAHEVQADYLHDFFKAIDRGIHTRLSEDPRPLILAGVTREVSIYRRINTYAPVLEGTIHGSPDVLGMPLLYAKARELMSAYSAKAMIETLREMDDAAGRGLLINDPAAVIEAARAGQVGRLVVSAAAGPHEETANWAALATIRGAGSIAILNTSQLATGMAAILRYRQAEQTEDETLQNTVPAAAVR